MCPDAAPPSRDPRRRGAGAALVLLLLTALGLIGHHTLPAGVTPAPHAAMATTATAADAHQHPGTAAAGRRSAPVAGHPAQACAEHRVCSSTVPARGVLLDAPPPAGLAAATAAEPASHRPATAPGIPWPGAPPPDLDLLSISRR
ncbi:hypothetical protein ACFVFS_08645 [Kitasatospora sp. NPDC057692]|uniref:hypothetical protein n=1 Tax=Kitasatospora sp. NPDC057692 TaxID=3346215 RepID=UPI0036A944EA